MNKDTQANLKLAATLTGIAALGLDGMGLSYRRPRLTEPEKHEITEIDIEQMNKAKAKRARKAQRRLAQQ